ncbi:unnamed protein product, partial [Rotaria magnacalcarata]
GYTTLLDEDTCQIRSDLSIQDSDTARRLRDKYEKGNGQINVTVLKALGEEQIVAFKVID